MSCTSLIKEFSLVLYFSRYFGLKGSSNAFNLISKVIFVYLDSYRYVQVLIIV